MWRTPQASYDYEKRLTYEQHRIDQETKRSAERTLEFLAARKVLLAPAGIPARDNYGYPHGDSWEYPATGSSACC